MKRAVGGRGGFTLLEVIVAMTIFAAGIVILSQLFAGALKLSAYARDAATASIYARQRMEEALLLPEPSDGVERGSFGGGWRWELTTRFLPPAEKVKFREVALKVTILHEEGDPGRATELFATRVYWPKDNAAS